MKTYINNSYNNGTLYDKISNLLNQVNNFDSREAIHLNSWINSIEDYDTKYIVKMKLAGKGDEDIAAEYEKSVKEIRTILDSIFNNRPCILEEKYSYLFEVIDFTEEEFYIFLGEDFKVYNFLREITSNYSNERIPLRKLLDHPIDFFEYRVLNQSQIDYLLAA